MMVSPATQVRQAKRGLKEVLVRKDLSDQLSSSNQRVIKVIRDHRVQRASKDHKEPLAIRDQLAPPYTSPPRTAPMVSQAHQVSQDLLARPDLRALSARRHSSSEKMVSTGTSAPLVSRGPREVLVRKVRWDPRHSSSVRMETQAKLAHLDLLDHLELKAPPDHRDPSVQRSSSPEKTD
jgi:hypothetical protein